MLNATTLGVAASTQTRLAFSIAKSTVSVECAVVATPPACAIDGGNKHRLVSVTTGNISFAGIEFRNGNASDAGAYDNGGALDITGGEVTADSDLFDGNHAYVCSPPRHCSALISPPLPPLPPLHTHTRTHLTYGMRQLGGAMHDQDAVFRAVNTIFFNNSAKVRACRRLLARSFTPPPCAGARRRYRRQRRRRRQCRQLQLYLQPRHLCACSQPRHGRSPQAPCDPPGDRRMGPAAPSRTLVVALTPQTHRSLPTAPAMCATGWRLPTLRVPQLT